MPFGSRFVSGTIAIAMAIGFAALGWWLWHSFVPTHPVAAHLYGFIVVATGALGLCLAVRNLIRPVPFAIQISDKGITAYRGRSPDLILWSDIKGAHAAVEGDGRVDVPIVALELVNPRPFYARLDADKPRWLGPDTGLRPNYYPLPCTGLDVRSEQILLAVNRAICRWGTAHPDPAPETRYGPIFTRLPGRAPFAIGLVLLVALFYRTLRPSQSAALGRSGGELRSAQSVRWQGVETRENDDRHLDGTVRRWPRSRIGYPRMVSRWRVDGALFGTNG